MIYNKSRIKAILIGLIFVASTLNLIQFFENISLLTLITALFCIIVIIEKTYTKEIFVLKKRNPITNIPIYLIIIAWISYFWSLNKGVTLSRNYAYTILPAYFLCVRACNVDDEDIKIIDNLVITGGIAYLLYVFATQGLSGIMAGRFATVEGLDQNATCATLFLILVVLVKYIVHISYKSTKKVALIILFTLILWLYLMTGSRGGLLALAAYVLIVFMHNQSNKLIRIALIALLAISVIYVILPLIIPESIYLRLFTADSYQTTVNSTGNRVAIWTYCIESVIPNMSLIGVGAGVPPYLIGSHFGFVSRSIHNMYLNMYMEFGVFGLPAFIAFIVSLIRKAIKNNDRFTLGALVGICIIAFFLESYSRTYFWNILAYCVLNINVFALDKEC